MTLEKASLRSDKNRSFSTMFGNLTRVAAEQGLAIRAPEMVVVGMQSDGKSSLVEALLGFEFNLVASTIGTRRPLVLSMASDPERREPLCRFRSEGGEEFEGPTRVEDLASEIARRTNAIAGSDKGLLFSPCNPVTLPLIFFFFCRTRFESSHLSSSRIRPLLQPDSVRHARISTAWRRGACARDSRHGDRTDSSA